MPKQEMYTPVRSTVQYLPKKTCLVIVARGPSSLARASGRVLRQFNFMARGAHAPEHTYIHTTM